MTTRSINWWCVGSIVVSDTLLLFVLLYRVCAPVEPVLFPCQLPSTGPPHADMPTNDRSEQTLPPRSGGQDDPRIRRR
jgi:hypothetical protein